MTDDDDDACRVSNRPRARSNASRDRWGGVQTRASQRAWSARACEHERTRTVPRARVRTMPRLTERQQLAAAMAASAADYEHERGTAVKTTTMKTTTTTTTTHGEHMG